MGAGTRARGGSREGLETRRVLDVDVDATSYADACARVLEWAKREESRYVCVCNVHMVMEAHDDPSFRGVVNGADLVTPDGMPLVWALRALGVKGAGRVYGPDLMEALCRAAALEGVPVGLYGGAPEVLETLVARLGERYPALRVVYAHSPPFGEGGRGEDEMERIRASGARVLFVALGCPKQERWMAARRGSLPAVMVGVGAAFDFMAGSKRQAPRALRAVGLEWAFRLVMEPRRLWRRYAWHNPRFLGLMVGELVVDVVRVRRE